MMLYWKVTQQQCHDPTVWNNESLNTNLNAKKSQKLKTLGSQIFYGIKNGNEKLKGTPCVLAYTFNFSYPKAEASGSQVRGQPGPHRKFQARLQSETLPQKINRIYMHIVFV